MTSVWYYGERRDNVPLDTRTILVCDDLAPSPNQLSVCGPSVR